MKVEIKIPKMGESILEATIGAILKPSGSTVKAYEEILEIETDKANQTLSAPAAGKLELKVKSGDVVKVDQVIGTIDTTAAPASSPPPPPVSEKPKAAPKSDLPPARKKVDQTLSELTQLPPKESPPAPRVSGRETRKKMTKLRRVIAERLVQVKNETAMLTTFNEVDMSGVIQTREKEQENFQKKHGVKLGFMSFFVKACVAALQEFPDVNARIDGDEIVYHHYFDIGIAVGTEKGLFVPVVRNADQLSFADIEKALKIFAEKARTGTISVDEMQGGTFTITNGGVYGSMLSTPILNPPQSGILGMHNIVKRPVVIDDKIVIRPIMYLALSYDHRIIDGKEAISFLVHIKKNLEDPTRLLLDL
ncbi:MAG TPA: dihydrolipoyllysine-residue succinyltransferase [Chlamydiales bacterium]|nr:dihydrolipoyllysine-residue succinyltransferase [Chlamydiales bacterium]